ncbi:GGDEF domain-containing protein [Stappia indica]|uniref:GGDEF domain-containing protein n=1 Tax=Stappia indica TaxID=538381 RepID=UPI001CD4DF45|nr:GGDEF domain-containing protein [Stappia indica]MCA1297829.1 GGDEF domain-containing protein [Stappia indica]
MSHDIDALTQAWRSHRNSHLFLANARAHLDIALQPFVDSHTGEIQGLGAHLCGPEKLGFDAPHLIHDFAAETGCLPEFVTLLRARAIAQFARLSEARPLLLLLPVSKHILDLDGALLKETQNLTAKHKLAPEAICLEPPTASGLIPQDSIDRFVMTARGFGFSHAHDGLESIGTPLQTLYEQGPRLLKLGRSFFAGLHGDARRMRFAASLVDLAHALGGRVLAQNVETEADLRACREMGCDLVQGALIAEPTLDLQSLRRCYDTIGAAALRHGEALGADPGFLMREMEVLPSIHTGASISRALEIFRANARQTVLPVLDALDHPTGLILEPDLKSLLYTSYGRDLLLNPTIDNHLRRFIRHCAVADIHTPLETLVEISSSDPSEGIVITQNGRYAGYLPTNALLKLSNETRLRIAQDQNPLTKLPGNAAIFDHVGKAALQSDVDRAFCYVDFDNFKPFNDTYGFRLGDRALMLFAEIARRKLQNLAAFIGHVGGDDFFLGIKGQELAPLEEVMRELRRDFRHEVESLHEANHRRQGFILASDRKGQPQRYPLLSCSIAVLFLPRRVRVNDPDTLSTHIAALKNRAKAMEDGVAACRLGPDSDVSSRGRGQ